MPQKRIDARRANQLRPVKITPDFVRTADGSCLIEMDGTRVICTASIENSVPQWRDESDGGWVSAEYGMLPASTGRRKSRPTVKPDSRGIEIQRLIGRSLRSIVRFDRLGANSITLDCDVLEADGGTRTASITGAYVALQKAVEKGVAAGLFKKGVLQGAVAAVSVGIINGKAMLDLCYAEDSTADVDMNVVMTSSGKFVEIQGTSEAAPFTSAQLQQMLTLAKKGIRELLKIQKQTLAK